MKIQKYSIILLSIASIWCSSCSKDDDKTTGEGNEPGKNYTSYYYYSYEAGEIISAKTLGFADSDFTPGPFLCQGDTLLIANVNAQHYSLELYNRKTKQHLASLQEWTYKGAKQKFSNKIEAIAISGNRLYLANIGSCIDVFNLKTLEFETRVGTGQWGENKNQMLHSHAMVVTNGYIVVRSKNRILVYQESDVTTANYQNVPFYCRTAISGFDTNNGFNSYQMVKDTTGLIFLTDFGQYGNRKVQAIAPTRIAAGDNTELIDADKSLTLEFNPRGIALQENRIFISDNSNKIQIYDRTRSGFVQTLSSIKGYQFKGPEKMQFDGKSLWVSDPTTKQLIEVNIYKNEIREYEQVSKDLVRLPATRSAGNTSLVNIETHELVVVE